MSGNTQFDRFAGQYEQILDRSIALSGEDSAYFAKYKAMYLRRLLSESFAGKVLDFGCGVGVLSRYLKQYLPASRVDGFDVSQESIRKVDPGLLQQGIFSSRSAELEHDYELIVVANVMHHVPIGERQRVVEGLAGRLRKGGWLAIFEHNPANPVTRWVVERCPFDDDAVLLPPDETRSYFVRAQVLPRRQDYIVFMPRPLSWLRSLEAWLAWLPLGAQYALIGEKNA
jgi:SAM-dependent methyltransferase